MRAAILEAQGQPLTIANDVEIIDPGPGQVRIKVAACGICHSDLSYVDNAFPAPTPSILGHEAAGTIESVGVGVKSVKPGDCVVITPTPPCGSCYWCVRGQPSICRNTDGLATSTYLDGTTGLSRGGELVYRGVNVAAFSEYVVADETAAIKIPSDVPLDVACVLGCAIQTGVGAVLNTAKVEEGATVLIMGLGGIGLSAVQGARLAGAARIIASDPVAERRDSAKGFGATDLLDPTSEDVIARTHEITGVGADYAFETAGIAALVTDAISAARKGGTIVCVGAPAITENITIPIAASFTISEKKLLGCTLGSCNSIRDIPRFVRLYQSGKLDLEGMITARRPLEEINEGMDDLRASRGIRTVLSIG